MPPVCSPPLIRSWLTIFSVRFYEFLGLKLLDKVENPNSKFDLYFLAFDSPKALDHGQHRTDREGMLELTHNYGTETDPNFHVANGNSDPGKGFGHICISVDDLQAACQRIENAGYQFQKRPSEGKMKNVAFALDPDGYWIELLAREPLNEADQTKETDIQSYRFV